MIISNLKSNTSNIDRNKSGTKFCASQGFTLIEMIVSLAIFSVVAVVALGALMKIVSANKKAQSLQSAMTNINYALESMSREMRVGSDFKCDVNGAGVFPIAGNGFVAKGCPEGVTPTAWTFPTTNGAVIAFRSSKVGVDSSSKPCNLIYAYRFIRKSSLPWDIQKATQEDCNDTISYGGNVSKNKVFTSLIDPSVVITGYYIKVTDSNTSAAYPLATIRLSGYVGARELERTYFNVQTSVSARVPSGQ